MKIHHLFRLAAIPAAAALMTACGGGGGGGGGGGPAPGSGTINGSSTKGIIKNGVVTISQPGGGGATGSGRTDATGRYSFAYTGYTSGPVLVCVTGDAMTRVVCDASDGPDCGPAGAGDPADRDGDGTFEFGDELPAPAGFSMCTCLPAPPANGISAPITPFTNVVVQRAMERDADAALSEDLNTALINAASEVNQLLGGLDVLRLDPVNLADPVAVAAASPEALVYAALIAAVLANSVEDAAGTPLNLNTVVESIRSKTAGGRISFADIRRLLGAAQRQLIARGEDDDTGVIEMLNDQVDTAEAGGATNFNPEPNPNANLPAIARARGLVQNVRNTYSSLAQYEAPLDAFGVDLEAAGDVVEANEATAETLSNVLVAAREFFANDLSCADEICSTTSSDGITTTFSVSGSTLTGTMAGTTTGPNPATVDIVVTAPAGHADGANSAAINIVRATVSTSTARLRVTTGNATVTLGAGQTFNAPAFEDDDPDNNQKNTIIDSASFDLVGSVEALSGGNVIASATGTFRVAAVRATACMLENSDPDDAGDTESSVNVSGLTIAGAVTAGSESADLTVAYKLDNARAFCPLTDIGPTNKPDADMTVTANLNLDAVPDARAIFTASLDDVFARTPDADDDRTAGFIANASVNLLQNGTPMFRLTALSSRAGTANNETVTATVTDSANAMMVLTVLVDAPEVVEGNIGVLTVDGVQVGVIRQLSSGLVVARYDDGSFESLF